MTVEQTKEFVESFPLAGFAPLVLGKGPNAATEDLSRFSLGQAELLPNSPDLGRDERFGLHLGPERLDSSQVLFGLVLAEDAFSAGSTVLPTLSENCTAAAM